MKYCDNCGCRTNKDICSSCQEELYILTFQGEHVEYPLSDEFIKNAEKQEQENKKTGDDSG